MSNIKVLLFAILKLKINSEQEKRMVIKKLNLFPIETTSISKKYLKGSKK